jgi:hypothetical protein
MSTKVVILGTNPTSYWPLDDLSFRSATRKLPISMENREAI